MIQKFLQTYKEAFGNAVPLPVTFGYSHIPVTEINKMGQRNNLRDSIFKHII